MPGAGGFPRPATTVEALDRLALASTGFEAARNVRLARDELMHTAAGGAGGSAA